MTSLLALSRLAFPLVTLMVTFMPLVSPTLAPGAPWTVRPLQAGDLTALAPILRQHILDLHSGEVVQSEVLAVLSYMDGMPDALGRRRAYYVALEGSNPAGRVLGCMALAAPDPQMVAHLSTQGLVTLELLNAFVCSANVRGQGVGRALFQEICAQAAAEGAVCLIVNSGPRYKASWGFYDRVCDSSHGFIDDYYGVGRHAKTWKKYLS